MPKDNIPEIRVRGFSDEWARRKLGDMGSTFTGLSGKTKEDFGHGDAKFITYMNVFSNPIADLQMTETVEIDSKQNCVKAGDVFFTTSSETPEEVGMSCVMPENADNTYLNSFCFGYRPIEKFDLNYLAYVLRSDSFRKEMMFLAQGISRYNISKNKVMEVEIPVPSLEEQSKVGRCFSNLESLISQHQHKYESLVAVKKAMLEKMFPKEGKTIPEIRFAGFTDPWEQRKLEDVARILGGNAWKASDYSDDGEYLVVTIANVSGEVIINDSVGNRISCDNPDVYLLNKGDILVSLTGNVGRVSKMSNIKGLLNQRVGKILPNNSDVNADFLFHVLRNPHFERAMIDAGQGAAQKNIRNDDVLNYAFFLPVEKDEQNIIAHYFNRLDNLITLHQRKCEVLKNLKSALLNKMFVDTTE